MYTCLVEARSQGGSLETLRNYYGTQGTMSHENLENRLHIHFLSKMKG